MKRWVLIILVAALYLLHQDYWFWFSAEPLAFGIFPIGLFYHAVYSVAVAVLMWALIRFAWPDHLEGESGPRGSSGEKTS
jgi:hypothetical protein